MKAWSWSDLGRSWGVLGRSWGDLGWSWGGLGQSLGGLGASWGGLGPLLEPLGAVLGGSWSVLGRSKIDQKMDPKPEAKRGRIATEKNGPNTTPVVVSELERGQRKPDDVTPKSYQNRYRND